MWHPCSNRCHALMRRTCGPRPPTGWTSPMANRCPSTLCAHRMGPIRRAERCLCARPGASACASIRLLRLLPNMTTNMGADGHKIEHNEAIPGFYRPKWGQSCYLSTLYMTMKPNMGGPIPFQPIEPVIKSNRTWVGHETVLLSLGLVVTPRTPIHDRMTTN